MGHIIKKSTLRQAVRTLLEDKSLGPAMVKVNPVVDPSAAVTDPDNENFVPQDAVELKVAVSSMVDELPQGEVPDIYNRIKSALQAAEDEKGKKQMKDSNKKLEESIRSTVRSLLRQIIQEAPPPKMPKRSSSFDPTAPPPPGSLETSRPSAAEKKAAATAAVWAKPAVGDLPPVTKFAPGTSIKTGTPDQQKASYEKNVKQLQVMFDGKRLSKILETDFKVPVKNSEQVIDDSLKIGLEKANELISDEVANAYKAAFEKTLADPITKKLPPDEQILSDVFRKEFLERVNIKINNSYFGSIGAEIEDAIAGAMASGVRKYTKGMNATLGQIAAEIKGSIALVKKIQPVAIGKFMLGMKSGIADLIPDDVEITSSTQDKDVSSNKLSQKEVFLSAVNSAGSSLDQDDPYTPKEVIDEIILSLQEDAGLRKFMKDMQDLFNKTKTVAVSVRPDHYNDLRNIVNDQLASLPAADTKLTSMSRDSLERVRQPVIDYIADNILGA